MADDFDPYAYDNYRAFIDAWLASKPNLSQAWLAGRAGMSKAFVNMVLRSTRDLALHDARSWADAMSLDDDTRRYFEALVSAEHAPSLQLRRAARLHVDATRAHHNARVVGGEAEPWIGSWVHVSVISLAHQKGFSRDPAWIAERLWPDVSLQEAEDAVTTLIDLGVLVQREDGRWGAHPEPLRTAWQIPPEQAGHAAKRLHKDELDHAALSLDTYTGERRFVASLSLPIRADQLQELIRTAQRTHLDLVEPFRTDDPDAVVEVLLAIYPRTR